MAKEGLDPNNLNSYQMGFLDKACELVEVAAILRTEHFYEMGPGISISIAPETDPGALAIELSSLNILRESMRHSAKLLDPILRGEEGSK